MTSSMSFKEHTLQFGVPESEVAFTREEYRRRLDLVRSRMAAAGLDLLYVTNPDHICYLSGYQAEWFQESGPKSWSGVSGIAVPRSWLLRPSKTVPAGRSATLKYLR